LVRAAKERRLVTGLCLGRRLGEGDGDAFHLFDVGAFVDG
jgi:hypothetical protein